MPRGGYRPGAGRKKRNHETEGQADAFAQADAGGEQKPRRRGARSPLKLLLDVVENEALPLETRMKAARDALPFTNKRPTELGKKERQLIEAEAATNRLGRGRFGRSSPPSNVTYLKGK